jgi:hypothetical protein
MSRKAPIITMSDFKDKIGFLFKEDEDGDIKWPYNLPEKVNKDLSKVTFDWENCECGQADPNYKPQYHDDYTWGGVCGYKILSNNLPVLVCGAGGDWEDPIFFILYWDGKQVRAYIPKEGNTWDLTYKTAHGSQQECEDFLDGDVPEENPRKFDNTLFEKDIVERIEVYTKSE